MSAGDTLKKQGIDVKKGNQDHVSVFDVVIPIEGPLAHPRAKDPVDEALLSNDLGTGIMDRGCVHESILIWRTGVVEGKQRLVLIAGSRRTIGLIEAVRRWKEAGTYRDGMHYIPVKYFTGDEKAAWKARLLENTNPDKKPDSPKVLAMSAIGMRKVAMTDEEILAVMPRSVRTKADLEALLRWEDLTPEAAARFDSGAPLALLGTVLDAPREAQSTTVETLVAAGAQTANKAARVVNKAARERGEGKPRPITPKQIRVMTVRAAHLGIGDDMKGRIRDEDVTVDLEELVAAAMADGFVLLGRLLTGEIKAEDLPEPFRSIALASSK